MSNAFLVPIGFANPFDFLPGFLLPVFATASGSNAQYLQVIDAKGRIAAFERAEIAGSLFCCNDYDSRTIGEEAVYAFGTGMETDVLFGTRKLLAPLLADIMAKYRHLPALYLSLVEFCATPELEEANRRAYNQIQKAAGAVAARSWRDSQVLLPIIRSALTDAASEPLGAAIARGRISVYSTSKREIRVRADGYAPQEISRALHRRSVRSALQKSGVADDVKIVLEGPKGKPSASRNAKVKRQQPSSSPSNRRHTKIWRSLEIAFEELSDPGLSPELRRWLDHLIQQDIKDDSKLFFNFTREWCERQTPEKAATVLALLLSLDGITTDYFLYVTHWLRIHSKLEAAGQVFAQAILMLSASEVWYRTGTGRIRSGPLPRRRRIRRSGDFFAEDLRDSSIPRDALLWVDAHNRSSWASKVLIALLNAPIDLPELSGAVQKWLSRSWRSARSDYNAHHPIGSVLLAILRPGTNYGFSGLEERALDWIVEQPQDPQVPQLWLRLFARPRLLESAVFGEGAMRWVRRQHFSRPSLSVFLAMIKFDSRHKGLRKFALQWISEGADVRDVAKLLVSLLGSDTVDDQLRWHAEHWLEDHRNDAAALPVLRFYFQAVSSVTKPYLRRLALDLILLYPTRAGVGALYAALLTRFVNDDRTIDESLAWLKGEPSQSQGRPLIRKLLTRRAPKFRNDIAAAARQWLRRFPEDRTTSAAFAEFRGAR